IIQALIEGGVVGPVKAHFGTVEAQGRGTLHLHLLVWLEHEYTPAQLKENIKTEQFRNSLIAYLEDIVKEDIDDLKNLSITDIEERSQYPAVLFCPNGSRLLQAQHRASALCRP
ncbi:unnamed protein product, partial [Didymodactylos carnosus]